MSRIKHINHSKIEQMYSDAVIKHIQGIVGRKHHDDEAINDLIECIADCLVGIFAMMLKEREEENCCCTKSVGTKTAE